MGINNELRRSHQATNALHTLLLLGGMGLLLLLLGFTLWGRLGAFIVTGMGLFFLWFSPRIAPSFIMRLYRARPIGVGELRRVHEILNVLTRRAGLRVAPRLYYLPTRVMNAFTIGDRNDSAIGLTDGMLRRLDIRELTGVLAHELSHLRNNDLKVMTLADMISRMTSTLSWFGQVLVIINLPLVFMGQAYVPWLAILVLLVAPSVAMMLQLALSRTREFDADRVAFELTGDAVGLASALEKMERYQRSVLDFVLPGRRIPDPSVLRTHPNTDERVRRLLELGGRHPRPSRGAVSVAGGDVTIPGAFTAVERQPRWHMSGLWY